MTRLVITLLTLLIFPQSAPPPVPPTPKRASAEVQARILRLQLQVTRIQAAYQSCTQQDFQGQVTQASIQMQEQVNAAFKEAGLDKKDWELNMETFEFVRKAGAVGTAPVPEAKKP